MSAAKKVNAASTPRTARALETRTRLIASALELFARQGYTATSTKQVAVAAGVSDGLIFHHFPTKLDLLMGVVSSHELVAARVSSVLSTMSERPAAEVVSAVTRGFVTMLSPRRTETQLFRVLMGESLTTPEIATIFRQVSGQSAAAIERFLLERVQREELRADLDVRAAATSLLGALFWFFMSHHHLDAAQWEAEAQPFADATAGHWLRSAVAPQEGVR